MKMKMFLFAGVLAFGTLLQASTSYNFDFGAPAGDATGTVGNSLTFFDTLGSGVSVKVTAYSTPTTGGTSLITAAVGDYHGYGVANCTTAELAVSGGCTSPAHQVDNQGQFEFMLFTFSQNVSLTGVKLIQYASCASCAYTDMDMSYWSAATSLGSLTTVPSGTQNNDLCAGVTCTAAGLTDGLNGTNAATDNGRNVKSVVIAAGYNTGDANFDFFKINSLTATSTATPEPASFVLIGSGLLIGAVVGRRRMKKRDK